MSIYFADQSWPKLEAAIAENTLVILPVGQTAGSSLTTIGEEMNDGKTESRRGGD